MHKCAKSCPNPWWFGQFLAISPSFRPKTPLSTHLHHGATMVPAPKLLKPWQPRCDITMWSSVPNHGPFHGGLVIFCPFPPLFVRKPLFRHISTMGTPCHQLQKIKTHSNQGVISQCAQGCQILPQSMVVWSVFAYSPSFRPKTPLSTHLHHGDTMPPTPKNQNP